MISERTKAAKARGRKLGNPRLSEVQAAGTETGKKRAAVCSQRAAGGSGNSGDRCDQHQHYRRQAQRGPRADCTRWKMDARLGGGRIGDSAGLADVQISQRRQGGRRILLARLFVIYRVGSAIELLVIVLRLLLWR